MSPENTTSKSKRRVYVYYDGSNFYHYLKNIYGITNINFYDLSNKLIDSSKEEIIEIKYFNCPLSQNEYPEEYRKQQRFFQHIRDTPLTSLFLGRLAKRNLQKLHINCKKCGHQLSETLICPQCKKKIKIARCFRYVEKGVDVKLATHLLLDAIDDKYDTALLVSNDADFSPATNYIIYRLKKEVVYCHFPDSQTRELLENCSSARVITEKIVKKSRVK